MSICYAYEPSPEQRRISNLSDDELLKEINDPKSGLGIPTIFAKKEMEDKHTVRIIDQNVKFRFVAPENPEEFLEDAGRTAYQSFEKTVPGSSGRFVRMLKKRFHLAVLEHAFASFSLVTSRAIANEIIRHRHTSMTQEGEPTGQAEAMTPGYALTQESTRWIRYEDGLTVIDNPRISEGEYGNEKHRVWADAMYYAEASYKRLLELGARPEDARDVLPLATKTEIVITTNFSQWLHIIRLRCAPDAHHMARELIGKIWERLKEAAPNVFWE